MNVGGTTRVACVIGDPVEHSRSPRMHNAASSALGLDRIYVALRVSPYDLESAIRGLAALGFDGANVTIPHKAAVVGLCDELGGLLVNCTPVGGIADLKALPVPADVIERMDAVADYAYRADGSPTPLVSAALAAGLPVADGLELLVQQGALSFRRWTGIEAPLDVMRRAARGG
jgi:shikimate 5-dehydrogenase